MIWLWIGFVVFILLMLWLDLAVLNRGAHVISVKKALVWSAFCVVLALLFNVAVYFIYENHWLGIGMAKINAETGAVIHPALSGADAAKEFLTGYLIEQSLSMDNLFVIAVIFGFFHVPPQYQHRVLFWGIMGALVMRGLMIGVGYVLIENFAWMTYVFAGLLLITAAKMLTSGDEKPDPSRNVFLRLVKKMVPVADEYDGQKFLTRINGKLAITRLTIVLIVVESTDVIFAVDSIPAIFAVTKDPFIVFTSNVFAILNLRSLYFALAGMMEKFKYVKSSLVFILTFVAVKMLVQHTQFKIPTEVTLVVIAATLTVGIVASLISARRLERELALKGHESDPKILATPEEKDMEKH